MNEISEAIDRLLSRGRYCLIDFQEKIALLQWNRTTSEVALNDWKTFRQAIEPILQRMK